MGKYKSLASNELPFGALALLWMYDEWLTLETSALEFSNSGNLILINSLHTQTFCLRSINRFTTLDFSIYTSLSALTRSGLMKLDSLS